MKISASLKGYKSIEPQNLSKIYNNYGGNFINVIVLKLKALKYYEVEK